METMERKGSYATNARIILQHIKDVIIHEHDKLRQLWSDPVLMEEDIQEANKVGKILLDAMWKYLTDSNE